MSSSAQAALPGAKRASREAFSPSRVAAIMRKEFVQMRRDRLTFAMIVGIPILQLVLFGYAINTDPKSLPTAVVDYDKSAYSRSVVRGLENTRYFAVTEAPGGEAGADRLLERGDVQFAVVIPPDFSRRPPATRSRRSTRCRRRCCATT